MFCVKHLLSRASLIIPVPAVQSAIGRTSRVSERIVYFNVVFVRRQSIANSQNILLLRSVRSHLRWRRLEQNKSKQIIPIFHFYISFALAVITLHHGQVTVSLINRLASSGILCSVVWLFWPSVFYQFSCKPAHVSQAFLFSHKLLRGRLM